MQKLNRREFLQMGGVLLAGAALRPITVLGKSWRGEAPPATLGRIILWRDALRAEPSRAAEFVAWKYFNEVIPLYEAVEGVAPWPSNPIWYRTEGGYIHSGYVQPVENAVQSEVITEVPETGFWAEVSVPVAEARGQPGAAYVARKLYYQTVYRVIKAVQAADNAWWYQLMEGITWSPGPYVPAWSVRRIPPGELTAISPERADKWIQININEQNLVCFEGDQPVFSTGVGSGLWNTATPKGEFTVLYKRHTRRMMGNQGQEGAYDLAGVPFPVYFTWSGVAIHGTYWHNDYGRRHSHGCVNVPSSAAKWIFRWVNPVAPYAVETQKATPEAPGTRIVVI